MKRTILAAALAALAACADYEEPVSAAPPVYTPSAREPVNPYVQAAETKLDQLSVQVEDVRGKAAESAAEGLDELVADLDRKREAARNELAALRSAAQDAWASANERFEQALAELGRAIDDALARIDET